LIAFVAAALALWMLQLVRRGKMYVGYAVVCLIGAAIFVPVVCVTPLRHVAVAMLDYFFPRSGLAVTLCVLGPVALIYVLSQLTIISNRLVRTVQQNAVRDALNANDPGRGTPSGDTGVARTPDAAPAGTPRT